MCESFEGLETMVADIHPTDVFMHDDDRPAP
jgi:hypothetical protein